LVSIVEFFISSTSIEAQLQYKDVTLLGDFDPTRIQDESIFLAAGDRFKYTSMRLSYRSDIRKEFSYRINANFGQFFNGTILGVRGQLNYRFQPYGQFALEYGYNRIVLDDPFQPANLWLVGPGSVWYAQSVYCSEDYVLVKFIDNTVCAFFLIRRDKGHCGLPFGGQIRELVKN